MPESHPVGQLQISIHALREEGDAVAVGECIVECIISIHALREEGDAEGVEAAQALVIISIHALREEGDLVVLFATRIAPKFLSTPSVRRATIFIFELFSRYFNFYPRPP